MSEAGGEGERRVERGGQMAVYELRVGGRLESEHWREWFGGMTIRCDGEGTVLRGPIADQAALYGLLTRLRDLALPLVSVQRIEEDALS